MKPRIINILSIVVVVFITTFWSNLFAKKVNSPISNQDNKQEIQACIDKFFPFAEKMLIEQKMFYPYAAAMTKSNELVALATYNDQDSLNPAEMLIDFKKSLKEKRDMKNIKLIIIFYDVIATHPETNSKSDAVAIHVEHINEEFAHLYYYPYHISNDKEVSFLKSYGGYLEKEILK